MKAYPIYLVGMDRRRAVVVGGGPVAERKVNDLLEAGAQVTLVSPALTPALHALSQAGCIETLRRPYRPGDLAGAFLVVAATDDPQVNQQVWREAEERACLVNVADDPAHCNFIAPAVIRRGDLTVAVSTGGSSPALARRLRERLEQLIGPEYGELARLLAELRPEIRRRYPEPAARRRAVFRLVDSGLLEIIREHGPDQARARAHELLNEDES
jgi:siroheme synthase-like protein